MKSIGKNGHLICAPRRNLKPWSGRNLIPARSWQIGCFALEEDPFFDAQTTISKFPSVISSLSWCSTTLIYTVQTFKVSYPIPWNYWFSIWQIGIWIELSMETSSDTTVSKCYDLCLGRKKYHTFYRSSETVTTLVKEEHSIWYSCCIILARCYVFQ